MQCLAQSSPAYFFAYIAVITYSRDFCFRHAQPNRKYRSSIFKYEHHHFASWMLYIQAYMKEVNVPSFSKPLISTVRGGTIFLVGFTKTVFIWFSWDGFRRPRVVVTDVSYIWTKAVGVVLHLWWSFASVTERVTPWSFAPVTMPWMWQWSGCRVCQASQLIWQKSNPALPKKELAFQGMVLSVWLALQPPAKTFGSRKRGEA